MSGYLAGKLYYWTALLLVLALLWIGYLVMVNMLPIDNSFRKHLSSQSSAGMFSLAKKGALCLLLAYFFGALILYG